MSHPVTCKPLILKGISLSDLEEDTDSLEDMNFLEDIYDCND